MKFVFYDALYLSRRGRAYLVKPAIYIAPPPVGAQYLGFSVAHQRLPAMKSGAICYEFINNDFFLSLDKRFCFLRDMHLQS